MYNIQGPVVQLEASPISDPGSGSESDFRSRDC